MTAQPASHKIALRCTLCNSTQTLELQPYAIQDLANSQKLKLDCELCEDLTYWRPVEDDRRIKPRRESGRIPIRMAIRVQSAGAGGAIDLVSQTMDVSREGAKFVSPKMIQEGTELLVSVPYTEGDELPGRRARVIRCEEAGGEFEVAVRYRK